MADKVIYWSKTALIGGAAGALDSIDGTALQDGEVAHVWMSNVLYIYLLDADSGAAESSPAIIAPDTNAGDKRWILQSYYSGSGTLYTDHIAESTAGHGVEIDGLTIKDSGFAIGSDADGDMYYRASSALARLAKGSALALLRMNSGATAPEWGSAGQIVFPATQNASSNANTLDDYEEGTWTPSLVSTDATWSGGGASGRYTKIGRFIFCEFQLGNRTLSGTTSNTVYLQGLPFSSSGQVSGRFHLTSGVTGDPTINADNGSSAQLRASADGASLTAAAFPTGCFAYGFLHYYI